MPPSPEPGASTAEGTPPSLPVRVRTIVAVSAGIGEPSSSRLLADRLLAATASHLAATGIEPHTEVIELREHAQDLTNHLLTRFPSPDLQATIDRVLGADGLVAVSPIFSASYSGLFKTFFDVLERDSLDGTPALVAATGGTARHSLALDHAFRPLFAYLGAAVVPTGVFAAPEDWAQGDPVAEASLVDRIDRAAAELSSAVAIRRVAAPPDPFTDPVPFERLLEGG